MKKILAGIALLALVLGAVAPVWAATPTAGVSATVTPMEISVTVAPISTDYGTMGVSEFKKADTVNANDEFVVTNNGNVAEDFDIVGADATGGVTWTLAGSIGTENEYVHAYSALKTLAASASLGTNEDTEWVPLDKGSTYKELATNVAADATQDLVLEMLTPSSVTDFDEKTTSVTIRATAT